MMRLRSRDIDALQAIRNVCRRFRHWLALLVLACNAAARFRVRKAVLLAQRWSGSELAGSMRRKRG
jgi:hypothetical protein